jgi:hypothetical protein
MSGKNRAGGLMQLPEDDGSGTPPHWIIYIATDDVDETVGQTEKLGGKVLKPAADIPNVGRFAVLSDPQGAAFAAATFMAPESGDPMSPGGAPGDFDWHELSTPDPEGALEFYTELFGWSKGAAHDMGERGVYQIISHGGKDVGGIMKARDNATPPSWLSYVTVEDAAEATEAAKDAGGRVLNGPMEVPGGTWISQLLDPQGGAFAIAEPPKTAAAAPKPKKKGKAKAAPAPAPADDEMDDADSVTPKKGKAAAKKAAAKTAPAKKAPAKKAPAKKAPVKQAAAAKKAPAKKAAGKKAPARKAPAKKAPAKKAAGKKAAAKKAPAKKAPAKKAPAKQAAKRKK